MDMAARSYSGGLRGTHGTRIPSLRGGAFEANEELGPGEETERRRVIRHGGRGEALGAGHRPHEPPPGATSPRGHRRDPRTHDWAASIERGTETVKKNPAVSPWCDGSQWR